MSSVAFASYLKQQALLHPSMQSQDVMKLCFQAAFGAEHILRDKDKALEYLLEEFDQTPANNIDVFEAICNEYSRCNIAAWKHLNLPTEWLFRMFYNTASSKTNNSETYFMECLDKVADCVNNGILPFSMEEWENYRKEYMAGGIRPLHHSESYRFNERPAYRIVKREYVSLLLLLQSLASLSDVTEPKIIVIDGRAASGKTTISSLLSQVLCGDLIHMDDFFLPMGLRTKERLSGSGGNIHYERFKSEVISNIKNKEGFLYRTFDCGTMDYGKSRIIKSDKWRIVEGSYSCHPSFGNYMDYLIFCDISSEEQMNRIVKRNGLEMAQIFALQWIPMEEQYFKVEDIKSKADIVIDSSTK
ncbi:MAG: hypothetical protein GX915_08010 [Clostridiales bacterium]|nr:hypothetical protein [Clostridiales bacterium]